ncbi:MAG: hypothetical protein AAFX06_12040 [Planctomycetota bacterium]
MELTQLSDAGLGTRVLSALVVFAVLAALAASSTVVAMMMVLFLTDRGGLGTLTRLGEIATRLSLGALLFGVVVPPVLLVAGVPTVYCLSSAALGFACSAIGTLVVVYSLKCRVGDSRGG